MTLVSVVLGCPQMYERTAELLDSAFADYSLTQLADCAMLPSNVGMPCVFCYPLRKDEFPLVRAELHLSDPVPEKKGAIAGYIEIFLANNLIFSQNLYIMEG